MAKLDKPIQSFADDVQEQYEELLIQRVSNSGIKREAGAASITQLHKDCRILTLAIQNGSNVKQAAAMLGATLAMIHMVGDNNTSKSQLDLLVVKDRETGQPIDLEAAARDVVLPKLEGETPPPSPEPDADELDDEPREGETDDDEDSGEETLEGADDTDHEPEPEPEPDPVAPAPIARRRGRPRSAAALNG